MKKLLAALLALALLLPAAAMADQTVDLGVCVLRVNDDAYVTYGDKESGMLVQIIPDPNAEVMFYDNINVVWTDAEISDIDISVEEFAEFVMKTAMEGMAAQGVTVSNEQLIGSELTAEEDYLTLYYTIDVDYSNLGIDLQLTLHFTQLAMSFEDEGMYTFTCTASSADGALALLDYIDSAIEMKE